MTAPENPTCRDLDIDYFHQFDRYMRSFKKPLSLEAFIELEDRFHAQYYASSATSTHGPDYGTASPLVLQQAPV